MIAKHSIKNHTQIPEAPIMITIKTLVGFDEDRDKVRNKALEDSFHPPP